MANIDVRTIHASADLIQLVIQAGGDPKRSGKTWSCACPLHGGKNPSGFNIYQAKDGLRWKCFTRECGGGDSIAFVMKWQNIDFGHACKFIMGDNQIDPIVLEEIIEQRETWLAQEEVEKTIRIEENLLRLRVEKKWIEYHLNEDGNLLWENEGVPEMWQGIWQLGYCPDFRYSIRREEFHSPTITIPMFTAGWEIMNIRHRILNPAVKGNKYRPQYYEIPSTPFIADPDLKLGEGKYGIICEGEKKAMVTYITIDEPDIQVIGIPGKEWLKDGGIKKYISDMERVYICLDPDAKEEAEEMAYMYRDVARIIDLPFKIDDLILKYGLRSSDLKQLLKTTRRPTEKNKK
jgi:hypothetical protein